MRAAFQRQNRTEKTLRIGMLRGKEDVVHRPLLHDLSLVHDRHIVGDFGDNARGAELAQAGQLLRFTNCLHMNVQLLVSAGFRKSGIFLNR